MKSMMKFASALLAASLLAACGSSTQNTTSTVTSDVQKDVSTEESKVDAAASTAASEVTKDVSEATSKVESAVEQTPAKASESQDSMVAAVEGKTLESASRELQDVFAKNGWSVYDYELEYNEVSFDAHNGNVNAGVEVDKPNNLEAEFNDKLDMFDFETSEEQRYTTNTATTVVLRDREDGEYEIVSMDQANGLLYTVDSLRSDSVETVLSLLESAGISIR